MFVLAPKNGDIFERETLAALSWLTEQGWQIPYSIRVDSITNFQHSEADGDELTVADLVVEEADLDAAALQRVRRIALEEPLLAGKLVAKDEAATAVSVTVRPPTTAPAPKVNRRWLHMRWPNNCAKNIQASRSR
ncbi:MAG: hypothetical protein ACI915_002049 [Gammaproteobacteria bacterium]